MRFKSFVSSAACGALTTFAIVACSGDASPTPTPTSSPEVTATPPPTVMPTPTAELREITPLAPGCPTFEGDSGGLLSDLSFDSGRSEFAPGELISITLTLTNCDAEEVRLFYRDAQRYEFIVEDEEDREVWRWSRDQAFTQAKGEETIASGEIVTYTEVWDQGNNEEQRVGPGRYQIFGFGIGCADEAAIASGCHFGPGLFISIAP